MTIQTTWSTDQTWQIIHCEIWLDKWTDTALNRHILKGFTMESVYWFQNVMKSIHETKQRQNMRTKIIQRNDTKCIIYTHRMSDMPPYKACNSCIDSLGNTHPLKVDTNLQWMSHHPTNPTYNPVLSGTMTHSSAWCLNSTTRTHNTNTYTPKVCIRYLTYCMPTLWKWFMTCNT